jgi:DNA-binding GntR family transcriptional regulator
VRGALELLEKLGILVHHQNRGFFVAEEIPDAAAGSFVEQSAEEQDDYQTLAEDWLTDRIPEIVTEKALRDRYGVSKAKVTELLARAAREGWAERKDGYGWRLLPVAKTAEAFEEIYRFRMVIEPAALLEPSFELNRQVLTDLRRVQERMLQGGVSSMPPERLLANGADFHEQIIRMSNNPFFLGALERVNRMRRLLEYRATINRERLSEQCSEHLEILSLLEKGEVLEASYFMRRHLSGALKRKSPITWAWSSETHGG